MAMALQSAAASAAMVGTAAPPPTVAAASANSVGSSPSAVSFAPWKSSSFFGQRLHAAAAASIHSAHKAGSGSAVVMAASSSTETETEAPAGFTPPELKPETPSPIFGGSTGGLLRKAQVEEFYVITWESPKEQIFEMPTGGAAIMRQGPNLLKLARKEQCLALGTRLRSKYKINYQFYRVFPNGEVQYLHPKDGVYPEKANPGRKGVGQNMRSIGKNVNPIDVKFTGKQTYDV